MIASRRRFLVGAGSAAAGLLLPRGALATTLQQSFANSASFTLNSTSWVQAVTISSDAVNVNTGTIGVDYLLTVAVTFPNSTIGAQKAVNLYVSASEDGTNYDDNDQYSGSNNSQTSLRSPTNFKGPGVLNATQNVATVETFSLLALIGWRSLPRKFGVILENQCNQTISTKSASYSIINFTNSERFERYKRFVEVNRNRLRLAA